MSIENEEQLQEELENAREMVKHYEKEQAKVEALNGAPAEDLPEGITLVRHGVDNCHVDEVGYCRIGDTVIAEPEEMLWNEDTGELISPHERQAARGELPEWDVPEKLSAAHSTPCADCGHATDLRDQTRANITGSCRAPEDGMPSLAWTCRCGSPRHTRGDQLPQDLRVKGDEEAELLHDLTMLCEGTRPW